RRRARPRRRPHAAVGATHLLSPHPPGLGRRRLRRPTAHLGSHHAQADRPDRRQARRTSRLHRATPPLGGRTHPLLDQPLPAHRQRLRTPARPPRRDGPMVHGHHHDPTTRPLPNHQPITDHTDHLTRFFNRL